MSTSDLIALFTRFPRPGHSKTRLIPHLGAEKAALLQKNMTETIIATLSRLQKLFPYSLEIHFTGGSCAHMRSWLGDGHRYKRQPDGTLDVRIAQAVIPHLQREKTITVLGADCPGITEEILRDALHSLSEREAVIGPSCDGGYYLLGVRGDLSEGRLRRLFTNIAWGTDAVYAQTMSRMDSLNLHCHILPKLHDIDTADDLRHIDYYPDAQ